MLYFFILFSCLTYNNTHQSFLAQISTKKTLLRVLGLLAKSIFKLYFYASISCIILKIRVRFQNRQNGVSPL